MNQPQTGGSYRRETDGSLTRLDARADPKNEQPADAPASNEQSAGQSADTETPTTEDASGKKGKA